MAIRRGEKNDKKIDSPGSMDRENAREMENKRFYVQEK